MIKQYFTKRKSMTFKLKIKSMNIGRKIDDLMHK